MICRFSRGVGGGAAHGTCEPISPLESEFEGNSMGFNRFQWDLMGSNVFLMGFNRF